MEIVIIGAVAGGASAAARARRLDEGAPIVLIERGAEPSFANYGLPCHVGGAIESRDKLQFAPVERLRELFDESQWNQPDKHDTIGHPVGLSEIAAVPGRRGPGPNAGGPQPIRATARKRSRWSLMKMRTKW